MNRRGAGASPVNLVMARIGTHDQHKSVEFEISSYLETMCDAGLVALLQANSSWATMELIEWASERNCSVYELLEHVDFLRNTDFAANLEVSLDKKQLRAWIRHCRPELSDRLTAEPI